MVANVEVVLADMAARSEFHVAELAAELLKLCRRDADVLRTSLLDPQWSSRRTALRARVADVVRDRGLLDDDDANELGRLAQQASMAKLPHVLIARSIAEGIDLGAGQLFGDWFGDDQDFQPGDPIVVAANRVHRWVSKPSGNPVTRTEQIDRLDRLRLVPVDTRGVRASMRWLPGALAPLEYVKRFGIGVVEDPHHIATRFQWERYTQDGQPLFFGVRPTGGLRGVSSDSIRDRG